MSRFIPLNIWIKKHGIKQSDIISYVDGLDTDVRELSNILGYDVALVVKEPKIRNKKGKNANSKLKMEYKQD